MKGRIRVNQHIRATELRVIGEEGENIGVLPLKEALALAQERGVDLIETVPQAKPPVAKIMEFGKWKYLEEKKLKKMRTSGKPSETKAIQIKVATGEHDLNLKAKKASKWLEEGHRIKVELYLAGRVKYKEENFLKERLDRILQYITVPYKISEDLKRGPKGLSLIIEKDKKKKNEDE